MVRQLAKSLNLSDQLLTSGELYANPGSCSVPLTLAAGSTVGRSPRDRRTPPPLALLAGFGAGLSAAAAFVELSPTCERGVVEL